MKVYFAEFFLLIVHVNIGTNIPLFFLSDQQMEMLTKFEFIQQLRFFFVLNVLKFNLPEGKKNL